MLGYIFTIVHFALAFAIFYAIWFVSDLTNLFRLYIILSLLLISFFIFNKCILYKLEVENNGNSVKGTTLSILQKLLYPYKEPEKNMTLQVLIIGLTFLCIKFCLSIVQMNFCRRV
jgi:hypothetical protein